MQIKDETSGFLKKFATSYLSDIAIFCRIADRLPVVKRS